MKKSTKRILSLFLVLMMVVSLFPTAYAAETGEVIEDEGYGSSWEDWDVQPAVEVAPIEEEPTDPFVEEPVEEPAPVEEPVEEPAPAEEPVEEPVVEETPAIEEEESADEEEEEESFPANTFYFVSGDGLRVTVDAPEGAFPIDAEMNVSELPAEYVQDVVNGSGVDGEVLVAADITFTSKGEVIQPKVPVDVTIISDVLAEATDPFVVHVGDESVDVVPQSIDPFAPMAAMSSTAELNALSGSAEPQGSNTITFKASSFSVYAVVQNNYVVNTQYILVLYSGNTYYAIGTDNSIHPANYTNGQVEVTDLDPANADVLLFTYNNQRFVGGSNTYRVRNTDRLATARNGDTFLRINNNALDKNSSSGNSWRFLVAEPQGLPGIDVTLQFIDEAGNPVYVSIDGSDVTSVKLADVLTSGTLDMSTYKASAASGGDKVLTFSNAHYKTYDKTASASGSTARVIGGSLQKGSGRNYQYYRANGQNSVWTNFNADDTVYLVFSALAGSSGGSSGGGDEDPPALDAVGNSKTLTDKEDGTYSLTLSVTGSAQSKEEETDINVLFIIDNSNSMSWNDSENKNKLASTKAAVINMAEKLLENNTNSNPDAIELGLMNFNASASDLHTFSDNKTWTTLLGDKATTNTSVGFAGEVNKLGTSTGTNWEAALDKVLSAETDGDPTYVIFFTDGAPSQMKGSTTLFDDPQCYWATRDEARAIVRSGFSFYTIFAYGSSADETTDYLGQLVDYAYNDSVRANYRFNAKNTAAVEEALASILDKINLNFAYANVKVDDGVTGLSTTTLAETSTDSFVYSIKYKDYTSGTDFTEKDVPFTVNGDGTISIEAVTYHVKDSNSTTGISEKTTKAVTITGASYTGGSVIWDMKKAGQTGDAAIYMLEDAWTYSVSFDIWPSQASFDIVAALNNRLVTWGDDYTDPETGRVITYAEYKDQIGGSAPGEYYLKTNTHAEVTYQQFTAKTDSSGNITYTPVGQPTTAKIGYDDHMKLEATNIDIEKLWEHGLAEDELAELIFGKQFATNPEYTGYKVVLQVYCDDQEYKSFTFPKLDKTSGKPVNSDGEETTNVEELIWSDSLAIAPGILVTELPAGLNASDYKQITVDGTLYYVLSHGHDYRIEEVEGSDLHFDYESIVYHPMLKENKMINLDVETEIANNQCKIVGTTGTIQDDNLTKFVGTNTLKGGLNIRKVVTTGAQKDEVVDDCQDEFTFKITLTGPDGEISTPSTDATYEAPADMTGWSTDNTDPDHPLYYRSGCVLYNVYDGNGDRIVRKPVPAGGLTVTMPADGEIRVVNLTDGVTYTVEEITAGNAGYEYLKTVSAIKAGEDAQGDIIESSQERVANPVSGTIKGNRANLEIFYNWAASFYVYHSSDNTIEKISFADERVKGTYADGAYTYEFNIVDEVKDGFLYGGYYGDYGGKSADLTAEGKTTADPDAVAGLTYTDGFADDADGCKAYDAASFYAVKGSTLAASVKFWVRGNAAKTLRADETLAAAGKGTELAPKAGDVYFLKEVPEAFLHNRIQYIYDWSKDFEIEQLFSMTAVDDALYTTVGFDMVVIVEDVNGDTKVAKLCGSYTFNQHNDPKQTEVIKATSFAGVPNGYVGVYDDGAVKFIPIDTSTQFVVTPCWTTLDGVKVLGTPQGYKFDTTQKGGLVQADVTIPDTETTEP